MLSKLYNNYYNYESNYALSIKFVNSFESKFGFFIITKVHTTAYKSLYNRFYLTYDYFLLYYLKLKGKNGNVPLIL